MKKRITALLIALVSLFALAAPAFADTARYETPFEDSRFFEYGEYVIHYRVMEADEKKGQIFMIHGFALSSYCFEKLAKLLCAAGYTCVLADLPDFGYSSRDTLDGAKEPREDIMHALMTELSDEPWYLAAHSMGGYIALELARKYPDSVKNLLLYGTAGNDGTDGARAALMSSPAFIEKMGPIMEVMGRCRPLVRLIYAAACGDMFYAMHYNVERICAPYDIEGTGAGAIINFTLLPATDYDAVKKMPPILYINGSEDKVISGKDKYKFRRFLPEGSVDIVIDGAAHMVIETHAATVAEKTIGFIESL